MIVTYLSNFLISLLLLVQRQLVKHNKNTFFVILDVKSLYTNIPNPEGIEAAKEALNSVNQKPIATKVIVRFLV